MVEGKNKKTSNSGIFRKKSIDRISSPEELNDYMHVTNPPMWLFLSAVLLFLVGILCWSAFAVVVSSEKGIAAVKEGNLVITFEKDSAAGIVKEGMTAEVGDAKIIVDYTGRDTEGNFIAGADTFLPDGIYECKVAYRTTNIIKMILN